MCRRGKSAINHSKAKEVLISLVINDVFAFNFSYGIKAWAFWEQQFKGYNKQ